MMAAIKQVYKDFGPARTIILSFFVILCLTAWRVGLPMGGLLSDNLIRMGMNGIFVVAMVAGIACGIGLNFGLSLGILCGLIGTLVSIELDMRGVPALLFSIGFSIPLAVIVGYAYGWLLNKVKGSEMMIATFVGFSAVSLMKIGWLVLPFKSDEMKWPIGTGIRTTISLADRTAEILNKFLEFNIGGVTIPTGLLLSFLATCLLMWLFMRSKAGIAMKTAGDNPRFAEASGINVDRQRILGTIISTVLAAVGIIVYSQSFTFLQLGEAPMFMGFLPAAAILIGGASIRKVSMSHVLIGTFLLFGIQVVAPPVANMVSTAGNMAEISRNIISNGIIIYALTQVVSGGE